MDLLTPFSSEQAAQETQKALDKERLVSQLLRTELEAVQVQKANREEAYEMRIKELITNFENMKATNSSLSETEAANHDLNLRLLELKDELSSSTDEKEELKRLLVDRDGLISQKSAQNEDLESQIKVIGEAKLREALALEQRVTELQIQLTDTESDKKQAASECERLRAVASGLDASAAELTGQLERQKVELEELVHLTDNQKAVVQNEIMSLSRKLIEAEEDVKATRQVLSDTKEALVSKQEQTDALYNEVSTPN